MKPLFLAIFIFTLSLASCTSPSPVEGDQGSFQEISVETLNTMMNERRDSFLLINTHIPFEGNLPDTDLSIAYTEITENLDKFPADKDMEIIFYCLNDPMSRAASADLVKAGYTNVKYLAGGMNAWASAGFALEMEQ